MSQSGKCTALQARQSTTKGGKEGICGGELLGHWFFPWDTSILGTLESTNYLGLITAEYGAQRQR